MGGPERPVVTIAYCTQCNWLLRAGWMAQELLSTFGTELGGVTLVPGTGGIFEIRVGDELVWERKRDGGFPGREGAERPGPRPGQPRAGSRASGSGLRPPPKVCDVESRDACDSLYNIDFKWIIDSQLTRSQPSLTTCDTNGRPP